MFLLFCVCGVGWGGGPRPQTSGLQGSCEQALQRSIPSCYFSAGNLIMAAVVYFSFGSYLAPSNLMGRTELERGRGVQRTTETEGLSRQLMHNSEHLWSFYYRSIKVVKKKYFFFVVELRNRHISGFLGITARITSSLGTLIESARQSQKDFWSWH